MLGFYNYTVIITYLSVVAAGLGMVFSMNGNFKAALICLLLSGLCDMTDGAVARTRKRTEQEKKFGIQIDSLCDCISFGVQPPVFVYFLVKYLVPDNCVVQYIALGIGICFTLTAVIRLAFFNVMEEERQRVEGNKKRTSYQGLPVTNIAIILPVFYLCTYFTEGLTFAIIMMVALVITGFLYIKDFKMFKAQKKGLCVVGALGAIVLVLVMLS